MRTSLLFISGAGLPDSVWDEVREGLSVPSAIAPRPAAIGARTVTDYAQAALAAAPEECLLLWRIPQVGLSPVRW